jgi:hypothetical protein
MADRIVIGAFALAASLGLACNGAAAYDASRFPDWSGKWVRTYGGNPRYDQTKPIRKQEAPLNPQSQALFEASVKDQDEGGHGLDPGYSCLPQGMPRMMSGVSPFEFVMLPNIAYMIFERTEFSPRRIYTDGRDWPDTDQTWFTGYSIGKWLDTDSDGRYDTLEIETRHMRGPRVWGPVRHAHGRGRRGRDQGTDLSRQQRSEHPARRGDHDRHVAHAALVGAQDLPPQRPSLVVRG